MRKIFFTILLMSYTFAGYAQDDIEQYRNIYNVAEENYSIGRLDEAETMLLDHLKKFPSNLKQSAYRLLALCSLGNDDEAQAEARVALL